ncbi:hypothetical protein Bca101_078310 [Brassica carinata]
MDKEQRDIKAHKAYYQRVDFVSNSLQGIPQLCPCGSITKEIVDEENTYDYLPGIRYFICKDFEVGWCPFLVQSLVISFAFSVCWMCHGLDVSLTVTLANLVKRFDWKVDVGAMGDDKPDVAEAIGIDVCRKYPLIVCPSSA